MAAVHRLEHPVATALHRQVQVRHELVDLGVRGDQAVGHVVRVAGRIANSLQLRQLGELLHQAIETDRAAARVLARPGVDVLPEQRDLARAGVDQPFSLAEQVLERPRNLRAAGVGHDAVGAELVAPFLHRQECARIDPAARGQGGELGVCRHVGVGCPLAVNGPFDHLREAMIGLWTDDYADCRGAGHDLLAFGLGNAAGDGDQRFAAVSLLQPSDVRIDLLGRLLADVASVEHDEVRLFTLWRGGDAFVGEKLGHALAVIDVHLAAEAFDPEGLRGFASLHGLAHLGDLRLAFKRPLHTAARVRQSYPSNSRAIASRAAAAMALRSARAGPLSGGRKRRIRCTRWVRLRILHALRRPGSASTQAISSASS